jgi:hypothetical protein
LKRIVNSRRVQGISNDPGLVPLRTFLEQPHVTEAPIWTGLFGCQPPRKTVSRACFWVQAKLHDSCGFYNFRTKKEYRREARRILRWYTPGRRTTRLRRGIRRDNQGIERNGRKSAVSKKVRTHFRRLRSKPRVEGMWQWRKIALGLKAAGIPVQSGTVPVERYWSWMLQAFNPHGRNLSLGLFNVLSALCFVRYNYQIYNGDTLDGRFERDSIAASKMRICEMVLQNCSDDPEFKSEAVAHLAPLFQPFRTGAADDNQM